MFKSISFVVTGLLGMALTLNVARAADSKPLRVLLITGGCCHDYAKQKDILKKGRQDSQGQETGSEEDGSRKEEPDAEVNFNLREGAPYPPEADPHHPCLGKRERCHQG